MPKNKRKIRRLKSDDVSVLRGSVFKIKKCLVDKLSEMINRKLFLTIKQPYTF